MARRRRGRPLDGILVLDKPVGRSSNSALQACRAIFGAAKAGHTGSLDPLATGVLPVCFGEATKFSQFLLDADKGYATTIVLGCSTTTGDAEGEVTEERDASALNEQALLDAMAGFEGEIDQVPSMYSALKQNGRPLYELARKGIEVERKARRITIYHLELVAFRPGERAEADVVVTCSKGTYIRSLAEDLGRVLGLGGHVSALRRTHAGPFDLSQAVTLPALEALKQEEAVEAMDALLLPVELALPQLPMVSLGESAGYFLLQGQAVQVPKAPTEGLVGLKLEDGRFVGVGEIMDDGRVAPRRLVSNVR
ncbi:MAG TPA: tRNA pseudouridine(55) synthase TruB [Spongiibacteraceae bacterium]|nr:tRNA pseudouridine(55) synthase TruB [Spongiibacteraceae bacterium]HCS26129.1 tRNA pseudouridine(55) synthase TruB [Spongiibacteraceae bacterium]